MVIPNFIQLRLGQVLMRFKCGNEFDSKALSPGEKFSHVFNNESLAGTDLPYFCQIHPAMIGTITIISNIIL